MTRFTISAAVDRLASLAAAATAAAPKPTGGDRIGNLILTRISDWPEPSSPCRQAEAAVRSYGEELAAIGGLNLMAKVYNEAIHRCGPRAVRGVSSAWTGVEGWAA